MKSIDRRKAPVKGKKRPATFPMGKGPQAQCIDYAPSSPVRGPRQEKNPAPETGRKSSSQAAPDKRQEARASRARPITLIYEPKATTSLLTTSGATLEFDPREVLQGRIETHDVRRRFNQARARVLRVQGAHGLARELEDCGASIGLRLWEDGQGRARSAVCAGRFCQHPRACVICAARRTGRLVEAYTGKILQCLLDDDTLMPVMVDLTQRTGPTLDERLLSLSQGITRLLECRRRALSAHTRNESEMTKVAGGVFSIEIKRGAGTGEWHPHGHGIWLVRQFLDQERVSREWAESIGQARALVYLKRLDDGAGLLDGLREVMKYNVKLGEIDDVEALDVFHAVTGKRLLRPFGVLWGVHLQTDNEPAPRDGVDFSIRALQGGTYEMHRWGAGAAAAAAGFSA